MTTNHQANGPVSLDRLHKISEILSKAAAQSDGGNLGYAMADAVKVIYSIIAAANAKSIVPDELLSAMEEVLHISDRDHEAWHKARNGIAACRAAMLQAGNSPVTPDGWIPVSERMPDKLIPVMVMYEDGEMWSAMWNGNSWDDGTEYPDPHEVTHWREMPAAPQQEVKS